jgi:Uma2 family endonuclease
MVTSLPVKIPLNLKVTDEQFLEFVRANPDMRLERAAEGRLITMPPTGSEGGNYNFELNVDLGNWNRQASSGKAFDSSSGFRLPNSAIRAPDGAWIVQARWDALTPEQRRGFAPICPDFVMELASETDDREDLRIKMQEYIDNGCRLGWLILPKYQQVEIYRPHHPMETVSFSTPLSGEDVLPGFVLNLKLIFKT